MATRDGSRLRWASECRDIITDIAPADPRTHEDLRRGPVRDSQCSEISAHAPGCGGGPRAHGGRQLRQAAV